MASSSSSTAASISFSRYSLAWSSRSAGISIVVVLGAERLVVPDDGLHAHQIDDALELALGADRQLDRDRLGAEAVDDVVQALEEVGADLVHLVGEDDARNLVLVALAPDRLGLRLDALVGVEHA